MKKQGIVLGIDQSYGCTGISLWKGLVMRNAIAVYSGGTNTDVRKAIKQKLESIIVKYEGLIDHITCERVRTASHKFVNVNFIKAQGALVATIVDVAYEHGLKVYSADTRSWKSRIVGTSKPEENKYGIPKEKWPTIKWCINSGYGKFIMESPGGRSKGLMPWDGNICFPNDNVADAIAIGRYGCVFAGDKNFLKEEK